MLAKAREQGHVDALPDRWLQREAARMICVDTYLAYERSRPPKRYRAHHPVSTYSGWALLREYPPAKPSPPTFRLAAILARLKNL